MYNLFILSVCLNVASSYKILGLFPFPSKSHYRVFDPLMVELANRGHNVTVYNTFPKTYTIQNYHEVDISSCFGLPDIVGIDQMKAISRTPFETIYMLYEFMPKFEEIAYCKPIIELWNTTEKYDVLITETFNTDIFFLYAEKLNIPSIAFHSNVPMPWHSEQMGLPSNPSYLPTEFSGYIPKMSFFERMQNFLMHIHSLAVYELKYREMYNDMAGKIFGPGVPRLQDVVGKVSILLLYTHFSYNWPKPIVPNVIEVGGLNIKNSEPLPKVGI